MPIYIAAEVVFKQVKLVKKVLPGSGHETNVISTHTKIQTIACTVDTTWLVILFDTYFSYFLHLKYIYTYKDITQYIIEKIIKNIKRARGEKWCPFSDCIDLPKYVGR